MLLVVTVDIKIANLQYKFTTLNHTDLHSPAANRQLKYEHECFQLYILFPLAREGGQGVRAHMRFALIANI